MNQSIYCDHNATTPVRTEAIQAMGPFWRQMAANPSSIHQEGQKVARKIRAARGDVAALLGVQRDSEIIFTSGATEANHTVFQSIVSGPEGRKKILTTAVEHSSVLRPLRALRENGFDVVEMPVDESGRLDLSRLDVLLTEETLLVSVMMANNETGVLFPIEEIGQKARSKGILFHVDAVQAVGKIPFQLKNLPVDFASFSSHKFGGPKGAGILYVKEGAPFHPLLSGGSQEKSRRAGTENVPGIIGTGAACQEIQSLFESEVKWLRTLRDRFEKSVLERIESVEVNGGASERLPNTSNLAFEGAEAEALLILLDEAGISASQGSACLSGAHEPSHVLKAMGLSKARAKSSVRFSFGIENTPEEVDRIVDRLADFVVRLRALGSEERVSDSHPAGHV